MTWICKAVSKQPVNSFFLWIIVTKKIRQKRLNIVKQGDGLRLSLFWYAKKQNAKYILIDFKNKQLSDEFDYINAFPNEGFYVVLNFVNKRKMKGYINKTGELVIPLKYWLTRDFEGGIAVAETHDFKAEVLNKKGEVLYSGDLEDIFNLGDGCILAENNNGEFEVIRLT